MCERNCAHCVFELNPEKIRKTAFMYKGLCVSVESDDSCMDCSRREWIKLFNHNEKWLRQFIACDDYDLVSVDWQKRQNIIDGMISSAFEYETNQVLTGLGILTHKTVDVYTFENQRYAQLQILSKSVRLNSIFQKTHFEKS